jgi:hypothetical protein
MLNADAFVDADAVGCCCECTSQKPAALTGNPEVPVLMV